MVKKKKLDVTAYDFEGKWLIETFDASTCFVANAARMTNKKDGWELNTFLVYVDYAYRAWILEPGYVWDGPSYPSDKTIVGKLLKKLIGDRQKKGLLAASAVHDVLKPDSYAFQLNELMLPILVKAIETDTLSEWLRIRERRIFDVSIPNAAILYRAMLNQWPLRGETIGRLQSFRQFIGLLIFQPWYRVFRAGPSSAGWIKVE